MDIWLVLYENVIGLVEVVNGKGGDELAKQRFARKVGMLNVLPIRPTRGVETMGQQYFRSEYLVFELDGFADVLCQPGGKALPRRHYCDSTEEEVVEHNFTHCFFRS